MSFCPVASFKHTNFFLMAEIFLYIDSYKLSHKLSHNHIDSYYKIQSLILWQLIIFSGAKNKWLTKDIHTEKLKTLSPQKSHPFFTVYLSPHWSTTSYPYYKIYPSGTKDDNLPYIITLRMKLLTSTIRIVLLVVSYGGCRLVSAEAASSTIRGKPPKSKTLKG